MRACDLRCDRKVSQSDRLRCCRKHLCGPCLTKVLRVDYSKQCFRAPCPFCRRVALVTTNRAKKLFYENCSHHAKVLDSELGSVVVVHAPASDGGYGENSTLQMVPTWLPDLVDELLDEVDELSDELARVQETRPTLEEENRNLREPPQNQQDQYRPTFDDDVLASRRPT